MGKKSQRIDAYVAKAPEFARPVLAKLGTVFHYACPEIEENIRWRTPAFEPFAPSDRRDCIE